MSRELSAGTISGENRVAVHWSGCGFLLERPLPDIKLLTSFLLRACSIVGETLSHQSTAKACQCNVIICDDLQPKLLDLARYCPIPAVA